MSFLDSLENNLKSLESREEGGVLDIRSQGQRDSARAHAQASARYAEQLRKSPFTEQLLRQVTRIGYSRRTKVQMTWIGNTLRLEARDRKLELRPVPEGVVAAFIESGGAARTVPVDLSGDPDGLAQEWLATLPPREPEPPVEFD